jgi:hypothetical protein
MAGSVKYNVPPRVVTKAPAKPSSPSYVGNETKVDMKGAMEGGSRAEGSMNPLKGAVRELQTQHPERYDDHGPHHSGSTHVRHQPLGGLKPSR